MATQITQGTHAKAAATGQVVTGPSRCVRVIVINGGSGAGNVYDNTAASGNAIATIPSGTTAGTVYEIDYPCDKGIYVSPGTGQVLNVVYSVHKG